MYKRQPETPYRPSVSELIAGLILKDFKANSSTHWQVPGVWCEATVYGFNIKIFLINGISEDFTISKDYASRLLNDDDDEFDEAFFKRVIQDKLLQLELKSPGSM